MSLSARIRRAEGPLYHWAKVVVKNLRACHIPVKGPARWVFAFLYGAHVGVRECLGAALRFFWYEPLFRSQCQEIGSSFQMEQLPYISGSGTITLGCGVRLSGKSAFTFSNRLRTDPELVIGDGTFIGHECAFIVSNSIRVGRDCLIAAGVRVADSDGHPLNALDRRNGRPTPPDQVRPVVIGNDVWVGAAAVILKGVTIGDRSVVGARAVVTRNVPPDTIVAGNPARAIRRLEADNNERRPQAVGGTTPDDQLVHSHRGA